MAATADMKPVADPLRVDTELCAVRLRTADPAAATQDAHKRGGDGAQPPLQQLLLVGRG
jgi:hypothetical protein